MWTTSILSPKYSYFCNTTIERHIPMKFRTSPIKGSLSHHIRMSETNASPKPRNIRMKVETPPILPSKGGASVIVVFIIHNLEFIIMPRKRPRLWRRQVR